MWLLETRIPWQPQSHLFANISDCVSLVQDGSNETDKFDMERKSFDPGQAQALETWHKSTQCSRATQHHRILLFSHYSWHLENELGPTGFIIQPLISATLVRSGGGWYNRILLYLCIHYSEHPQQKWGLEKKRDRRLKTSTAQPLPFLAFGDRVVIQYPVTKIWATPGVLVEVGPNPDYMMKTVRMKTCAGRLFRRNHYLLRRRVPLLPGEFELAM